MLFFHYFFSGRSCMIQILTTYFKMFSPSIFFYLKETFFSLFFEKCLNPPMVGRLFQKNRIVGQVLLLLNPMTRVLARSHVWSGSDLSPVMGCKSALAIFPKYQLWFLWPAIWNSQDSSISSRCRCRALVWCSLRPGLIDSGKCGKRSALISWWLINRPGTATGFARTPGAARASH